MPNPPNEILSGPGGVEVIDSPPATDAFGYVVRPLFGGPVPVPVPVFVEELPATNSHVTAIAGSLAPVVLLNPDPDPTDPNRLGWSVRNTSQTDILYVLASPTGVVSPTFHTVALRPTAYYEDPYHYVGLVTGVWGTGPSGEALVTEYTET